MVRISACHAGDPGSIPGAGVLFVQFCQFSYQWLSQIYWLQDTNTHQYEKQQKFLQEYHQLKDQMNSNDELLFMDGAHPQHNPVSSYAWIMKGQEKEVPTNTGRKRININGAINIKNYNTIAREDERINAQSTIELLKQIEDAYPAASNIYIIGLKS